MRNTRAGVLISSGRGRTVVESASHSRTNFIFVVILALLHPSEGPGFGRTQKSFSTPPENMMQNGASDGDHASQSQVCRAPEPGKAVAPLPLTRSEEHTSELQSLRHLV